MDWASREALLLIRKVDYSSWRIGDRIRTLHLHLVNDVTA